MTLNISLSSVEFCYLQLLVMDFRGLINYFLIFYFQVAVMFADLHDTPERMLDKGVIQGIIPWDQSRSRFYWRLRRLIAEDRIKKQIRVDQPCLSDAQIDAMLRRWFFEERGSVEVCSWALVWHL